jgi:CheY-like chemotaxis protein
VCEFGNYLACLFGQYFAWSGAPCNRRFYADSENLIGTVGKIGANVVLARNGFEGLEATKNNRPDLVVSDIEMPGMDGYELLREIRAFRPDTGGSIPVIAMTAFVTYADRARILNAGFQECLPKPFTPDKLLKAILTVLND